MEESTKGWKPGRISFAAHHSSTYPKRERLTLVSEPTEEKEHSLDILKSPLQAMEFLSRSWSPYSSDFFQKLSLNTQSLLLPSEGSLSEKHEDKTEAVDTKKSFLLRSENQRMRVEDIWTWLSNGRPIPSARNKHKPQRIGCINVGHMKAWFGGELLGGLSGTRREKRKEELRLHRAQVHAALSVAQLAAAVAGVVADGCLQQAISTNAPTGDTLNRKMNAAVASAAVLVATVCAEAAESAGASKAHIASAISSGLADLVPADMLTVTATAATCLRGAATLKQRATGKRHVQEGREMLAKGSELPIRTTLGKIRMRLVRVYPKHDKLMLRLGKKYLQGALTRYKEYRIIKAGEETKEGDIKKGVYGFCLLTLGTTGGTIELLFDDERLRTVWKSTISLLLCDHVMFSL